MTEKNRTKVFVFKNEANNVPNITPIPTNKPNVFNKLKSTAPCFLCVMTEADDVIIVIENAVPTDRCIIYCLSIINVSKIKKRKGTDIKPPPIPNNPAQKPTGIAAIIIKRMKKI